MNDLEDGYICDLMLIKMARWLRIMGEDVLIPEEKDDDAIIDMTLLSGRILLTRDKNLSGKRGIRAKRIVSDKIHEQLLEFLTAFPDSNDRCRPPSRCPLCNGILKKSGIDDAYSLDEYDIPEGVLSNKTEFYLCPCKKVYWKGTHWEKINSILKTIGVHPRLPD